MVAIRRSRNQAKGGERVLDCRQMATAQQDMAAAEAGISCRAIAFGFFSAYLRQSARMGISIPFRPMMPRDRVAVPPFANISPDQVDEYFADGMTEELISSVSRIKGLRVIARMSVMRYKSTKKPILQIGRELNLGSVLEGSVRKVLKNWCLLPSQRCWRFVPSD